MWKNLFLGSLGLTLIACNEKQDSIQVNLAGNRKMAVSIRNVKISEQIVNRPELKTYFFEQIKNAIHKDFGTSAIELPLESGVLESPENLYLVAKNKVDDLYLVDVSLPGGFELPPVFIEEQVEEFERQKETLPPPNTAKFDITIVNGGKLRTVTVLQFTAKVTHRADFEKNIQDEFKKAADAQFPNPNVYPLSDPLHFANLLYVFGEEQMKKADTNLTCENATQLLENYGRAAELFEMSKSRTEVQVVGTQESAQEVQTRLEESKKKMEISEKCKTDKNLGFQIKYSFQGLDPAYEEPIKYAFAKAKFAELIQKYTDKPVELNFRGSDDGKMSLVVEMRYDNKRYKGWTMNRIPDVLKGYHVLSLDPYYAIMQTLIFARRALPGNSPKPLAIAFQGMEMSLALTTLLAGDVTFKVDGRYIEDRKAIDLFYPNSMFLSIPGYESRMVFTKSNEIFQDRGWLSLGSCRTLDGALTEDGLILRFFGLPCKL